MSPFESQAKAVTSALGKMMVLDYQLYSVVEDSKSCCIHWNPDINYLQELYSLEVLYLKFIPSASQKPNKI
jgi:hypothetical protein